MPTSPSGASGPAGNYRCDVAIWLPWSDLWYNSRPKTDEQWQNGYGVCLGTLAGHYGHIWSHLNNARAARAAGDMEGWWNELDASLQHQVASTWLEGNLIQYTLWAAFRLGGMPLDAEVFNAWWREMEKRWPGPA